MLLKDVDIAEAYRIL